MTALCRCTDDQCEFCGIWFVHADGVSAVSMIGYRRAWQRGDFSPTVDDAGGMRNGREFVPTLACRGPVHS